MYTWGDLGMVGSVELLVSPPKVGKTSLCTQLANAQRTGSPFLGWPTLQSGTVWLVEETPLLFDPKRRQASGLPAAPEKVSERTWRHRPSTNVQDRRIADDQSIPKSYDYTNQRRKWSLFSLRIGNLYLVTRKWAEAHKIRRPLDQSNQSAAPLLAILYGPLVDRGLSPLASHLAMACTVATVKARLTGIPFHTIQIDSLFHWCPEAETDSNAAMAVMQLFKTVASFGFLVRVVVHADEATGTVKGPQNITRQCDFLVHLSPLPKSAKARNTSRRLLSPEGRFSHRPNPGPLPYFQTDDGSLLPLAVPSGGSVPTGGTKNVLVSPDATQENTSASLAGTQLPAKRAPGATAGGQGDSAAQGDVGGRRAGRNGQVGHSGGSQGRAQQNTQHQSVSAPRARALRHRQHLVSLCPAPDQQPRPATEIVAAFQQAHGLQRDRVYALAKEAQQAGLVESTPIGSTRRLQWRRAAKS